MAGIIARITRSNRERLDRKKNEISTAKSNATLIPFDDHFVPEVSIKYIFFSYIEFIRWFHDFFVHKYKSSNFSLNRVCLFLAYVLTY